MPRAARALLGPQAVGPVIVLITVDMVITSSLCVALSRLDTPGGATQAGKNALKGVLAFSDEPLVSIDEELAEAMQTADVLVPTVTDKIDGRLMARAGDQLRLIAQFGAGVDNIDVKAATEKGIVVVTTPNANATSVAEHTLTAIGALAGPMFEAYTRPVVMGFRELGKKPIVEIMIPSTVDSSLAPPGCHVASLFCQHVNPVIDDADGGWDAHRDTVAQLMIDTVDAQAPNFARSVLGLREIDELDVEF